MLNVLVWMRKRKYKSIEHNNTRGLRGSAKQPTSTEETLKGYINNILECSTNPVLQ